MPNCNFFATPEDHRGLLDWLFAEKSCLIYELASVFEQQLRCFNSTDSVLALFKERKCVTLQLYVLGAGPAFSPRYVSLIPEACKGARFRYAAEGWGLVQLYLESLKDGNLDASITKHNSLKRAKTWAPHYPEQGDPDEWDFKRITSFSSRLNRQIKKCAVARIGSQGVLPGALKLWSAGLSLGQYNSTEHIGYFETIDAR